MCGRGRQFGMNLLEKVGYFIAKRGEDLHQQISGKRVFSAHITNATKKVLEVQGKPMVSYGRSGCFVNLQAERQTQHQETRAVRPFTSFTCRACAPGGKREFKDPKPLGSTSLQLTFLVKVPRVL